MTDTDINNIQTQTTTVQQDIDAIREKPPIDHKIWGIYILLVVVSLVELYSASSREVSGGNILGPLFRHGALLTAGFFIMLWLQNQHYQKIYKWTFVIVAAAVLATIYTMFFGQVINGARRSFSLIGISIQPSELLKMSAALFIARVLCNCQVPGKTDVTTRGVVIVGCAVLFFSGLLFNQGLTNTLVLMAISVSMMIIGGISKKKLCYLILIYCIIGMSFGIYKYVSAKSNKEHADEEKETTEQVVTVNTPDAAEVSSSKPQEEDRTMLRLKRVFSFLESNKYDQPINSENQQEQYSYMAQANGGIFGVFPGNSRETARLPLAFSDYIYAIIIEDIGLVGGIAVMILYLALLWRAGYIASHCKKAFPALLVIGMAVFIVYQALCHMAIVTGAAPVSGQPLPLISKGGSSIIISSVALGIMLSVSRFALRKGTKQHHQDAISSLSDHDAADNPTQL
jgi:cell division protein FtsW